MTVRRIHRQAGGSKIPLATFVLTGAVIVTLSPLSYAQTRLPALADSWNGVHSFLDINPVGDFKDEYIRSIAWRFDFGFSSHRYARALAAGNPGFINGTYISTTQLEHVVGLPKATSGGALEWLKSNHPDWILYQSDRVTPLQEYEYRGIIPDFTNPEYVNYKWEELIRPLAVGSTAGIDIATLPRNMQLDLKTAVFDNAIAFDNATLSNDFQPTAPGQPWGHACGVYDKAGHWVQKFAGKGSYADVLDPAFTGAMIDYLTEIRRRLHALPHPKLLIINTDPKVVFNDSTLRAKLSAAIDGFMIQGGALGPESVGDPRKIWLNNLHFIEDMNAAGKGVYSEQCEPGSKSEAGITASYIRFVLASYFLAKGHHCALRLQSASDAGKLEVDSGIYWPREFEAAHNGTGVPGAKGIGTPRGAMSQVAGTKGTEDGVFLREYSGGVSIVNASIKNTFTVPLPNGHTYIDLDGNSVGGQVTMRPASGLVLLKKDAVRRSP